MGHNKLKRFFKNDLKISFYKANVYPFRKWDIRCLLIELSALGADTHE